jgi:hypothetical protein
MIAFQALPHLRDLEVRIHVDEHSHEFVVSSGGNISPKREASEKRAITLYEQLATSRERSTIESVTVRFMASYPTKEWAFKVKRPSHGEQKFDVDRKFIGMDAVWDVVTPAGTNWDPWG